MVKSILELAGDEVMGGRSAPRPILPKGGEGGKRGKASKKWHFARLGERRIQIGSEFMLA
jgi:hypothetical protein